jgi:hypothetical protein
MKKKTKIIVYSISGIFLFLLLAFLYIGFFYEYSEFTFNFYVEETGEKLNGELFINDVSFGKTEEGKITIPVENLSITSFEFRTNYGEDSFNFPYDFSQDLLEWGEHDFIVYEEQLKPKKIKLIFYDNKTDCKLNGEIYVDDILLGETKEGIFVLTENEYKQKFKTNSSLYIFGRTDYCFGTDANLPFADYWTIHDLQYSFDNYEDLDFELNLDPRWPKYYIEMQDFVRPEETESYLEDSLRRYFKNNTWEDLDKISNFAIRYRSDNLLFNKAEYWQTPAESLKKGHGDCEDWAVTTLSLMRAYNDSINCYNILWPTHISILCYEDNFFVIYDQDETRFSTRLETENTGESIVQQENKVAIRKMRNNYFDWYGLSPNERQMFALFNEKELITFEEDEDFVNWAINLINN